MKNILFRLFSVGVVISFIIFIIFIHITSLQPHFSTLKNDDISQLKSGEIIYYGSSSCEACQEFNKVLKVFQDETQQTIYYWDATDLAIVKKAAEVTVYSTPTVITKNNGTLKIAQGYQSLNELKHFLEGD